MRTKTNLEQAQYFAQAMGFAALSVRSATVLQRCGRLQFFLTGRIPDDELVRLENSLKNWREHTCWSPAVARA